MKILTQIVLAITFPFWAIPVSLVHGLIEAQKKLKDLIWKEKPLRKERQAFTEAFNNELESRDKYNIEAYTREALPKCFNEKPRNYGHQAEADCYSCKHEDACKLRKTFNGVTDPKSDFYTELRLGDSAIIYPPDKATPQDYTTHKVIGFSGPYIKLDNGRTCHPIQVGKRE